MNSLQLPTLLIPIPLVVIGIVAKLRALLPVIDGWYVFLATFIINALIVYALLITAGVWAGWQMFGAYVLLGFFATIGTMEVANRVGKGISSAEDAKK